MVSDRVPTTMTIFRISIFLRSHRFHYSTTATATAAAAAVARTSGRRKPHLIVDYLVDSLRFSKQDAIALTSKGNLTHLKSTTNSILILNTLKNCGLSLTQIRDIVSSVPKILTCNADKTLEPKLRVFQELGLSGSDLVSLIKKNPDLFGFGLHTRIVPGVTLLKRLLGSDENVVLFINKSRWLYCTNFFMARLSTNASLLQDVGLSDERIVKFMLSHPENVMADTKVLENRMKYVEEKLGVSRDLRSFIHALCVVLYVPDSEVEKKMELFRSYGWSDADIRLLFRNQPFVLNKSEGNIREKLRFLMKDVGYTPAYLIRCHSFFTFSLSKRVMPRNKMLEILKEKGLVKDKPMLITLSSYSELRFHKFLRGFEDDIPGLCEIYMESVSRAS